MWRRVVLVLGLLGSHATADAQRDAELRAALAVEADPRGCITERALRPRVARWLVADAEFAEVEVVVHAAAEPPTFSVRRRGEQVAERRFDVSPARCADRIEALALAIALALEHAAGDRSSSGEAATPPRTAAATPAATAPAAAPTADPQPAPEVTAERDAAPATPGSAITNGSEPAADRARVHLHAAGAVLVAAMPEPLIAFGAGGDLQLDGLLFGLSLIATTESEQVFARGVAASQLFAARLRACMLWDAAGVELEGCAGTLVGAARASGTGYDEDMSATMGWIAPLLRAGIRFPRSGPLSLRLALEGMVNLVQPRLIVEGEPPEHAAGGVVAGGAGLELVVAIP